MRPLFVFLLSLLSGFTVAAAAATLSATAVGTPAQGPRCGIIRVHDAHGMSDGEIAYLYLQANLFEVETAELARAQGTAPQVRAHGGEVAKDHRDVVKMFQELLLKNGIKPITAADSAQRVAAQEKAITDLKAKTGVDFDRAYVAHEVANHRAVIKVVRDTFIPTAHNAQIAAHFKTVLPAFEHHLAVTIDAAKALGVPDAN
jgi:putative membrane protein